MAAKKVGFTPKPNNNRSGDVEKWVSQRNLEQSPDVKPSPLEEVKPAESRRTADSPNSIRASVSPKMKRLTIDITEELHRAIKMKAVERGTPMADMLRSLLESNYL